MKTFKTTLTLTLVFVIALSSTAMALPLHRAERHYQDGETFTPLRMVAEAFDAAVEWVGEHRNVIVRTPGGHALIINIDDIGGYIQDDTLFVPYSYAMYLFFWSRVGGTAPAVVVSGTRPQIHGMLTRIEYYDNIAYIFGSMHAGRPEWFPLHPMVEEAMARADIFGFEVDMTELANLTVEDFAEIIELQSLPEGKTLYDVVPQDVLDNFKVSFATYYDVLGIQFDDVKHLTPLAISYAIDILMLELSGLDISIGDQMIDGYIAAFAKERGKPMIGFEDILDQSRLLYDVPLEIQFYALIDFPDFETYFASVIHDYGLTEAYARQDIQLIREMLNIGWSQEGNPLEQHNHYINWYHRCNIYANGIAELLQQTEEPTTFFFTFGLSHIIGGNAGIVLYLLEDMGFELNHLWKINEL